LKEIFLVGIFVMLLGLSPVMNSAFAQSENFIVITETELYDDRCLTMTGKVKNIIPLSPVTVQVFGPTGNLVEIRQLDVEEDHLFNTTFVPTSNAWKIDGKYTVNLVYGNHNFEYLLFTSEQSESLDLPIIYKYEDDSKYFYEDIEGIMKNVSVENQGDSISYTLNRVYTPCDGETYSHTVAFQNYLVTNVDFNDNKVNQFSILVNDVITPYQLNTKDRGTTSLITFEIPFGHQSVEITATKIVPEFGILAMLILGVSAFVVITLTRTKLFPNILIR